MKKFFDELRRRNVFRAAGLYGVVGWLLAQAASLMENALALPAWFDAVVLSLLLIGFPLMIVFAWVFEMTPEGLKKTAEVPENASISRATGKKLDMALIVAVAALAAVILGTRFIAPAEKAGAAGTASAEATSAASKEQAANTDNSIAVLPFVDMSPAKDQEYFSDGISEELLNSFAQVEGLQVAGRTSSFAFKGQNKDLREIGEILNVAKILEGSVRKSGDQVRVTAQLIKAADGYHLWSQTYDRELKDIFAVQDEIAKAIVAEMGSHLPGAKGAEVKSAARTEIGAYERFLLAREKMTQDGTKEAYEAAVKLLDEAIAEDGDYAPALGWRSYAASMLSEADGGVGATPMGEALPVIKEYADRAMAADSQSPEALFALGSYYGQLYFVEGDEHLDRTIDTLRKAVEVRSNFSQAQNDLAFFLEQRGDDEEAMAILENVLAHDPGLRDANVTYAYGLLQLGRHAEAEAAVDRWAKLGDQQQPDAMRVIILMAQGRYADAWKAIEELRAAGYADNRINRTQESIRWALADAEWLEAHGAGRGSSMAALLKGDGALAVRRIEAYAHARQNAANALAEYLPVLFAAGESAKIVDYYERQMREPEAAIKAANACSCSLAALAGGLKEAGHRDFAPLMAAWKAHANSQRDRLARSRDFAHWEAQRAVLSGDLDAAKRDYARVMDLGFRDPLFATAPATLRQLAPTTGDFAPLRARMLALINEQREMLGLAPLGRE